MSESSEDNTRARFEAALEKKKQKLKKPNSSDSMEASGKLRPSAGNKQKMFRRKSG